MKLEGLLVESELDATATLGQIDAAVIGPLKIPVIDQEIDARTAVVLIGISCLPLLLYVLMQSPLALAGGVRLVRLKASRDVLLWHARGCPASVGVRHLDAHAQTDADAESVRTAATG